jgi:putative endonuclease
VGVSKTYYVYILSNANHTLYIGVTNDIVRRISEHKEQAASSFASKYGIDTLVHVEAYGEINDAILREKQLKNWSRAKKITLIERANPHWEEIPLL